ncbi:hypothetical protein IAU59_004004 [Kwoniella sp. CBS 9459]
MAPVIFGLDMAEFKLSKFGNKNMWSRTYHLRRTKFIVFQLAMIFCVVSESLGTDALSRYVDQQKFLEEHADGASEYNNDYIGVASYNIFAGIYVATIFGGAFFFDLIWPERHEDRGVRIAWKICSVTTIFVHLASCIAMSVIVAQRAIHIEGISEEEANRLLEQFGRAPNSYKHSARALASVVLAWVGWVFVVASAVVLIRSKIHDEKMGPWSTHIREAKKNNVDKESQFVDGQTDEHAVINPLTGERLDFSARHP